MTDRNGWMPIDKGALLRKGASLMTDLSEAKRLIEAATPGPWIYSPERNTHDSVIHRADAVEEHGWIPPNKGGVVGSSEWTFIDDEDATLIVWSRNNLPTLLAEHEAALARVKALEDGLRTTATALGGYVMMTEWRRPDESYHIVSPMPPDQVQVAMAANNAAGALLGEDGRG